MAQFESITGTTELEAVNKMLAATGESPIDQSELDSPTQADVTLAVAILKDVLREGLTMGWRFNIEFGVEIVPTGDSPYTWTGRDSQTEDLNIFAPPSDLIRFVVSNNPIMMKASSQIIASSDNFPKLVTRSPQNYSGTAAIVFWDQALQRDGLSEENFPYLYIDYVRYVPFSECPEVFLSWCIARAARQFSEKTVGDAELSGFTKNDVAVAFRNLKREQGMEDSYNMLKHSGTFQFLGWPRLFRSQGSLIDRDSISHQ
jgi:hypothetical protein